MSIVNEIGTVRPRAIGPTIQTDTTEGHELQSSPLDPTWVIAGEPVARSLGLGQSADGLLTYGLWDCTAGKFKYVYGCDEIVHLLEGEVTIEQGGRTHTLRAGDVAYFPAGATAYWTVPHYVKKFCIFRSVQRSLLSRAWSKLRQLLALR
jgi:uncharacterized cupin superfamily protein